MKRIFYFLKTYFIDIVVSIVGAVGALYAWNYGQQEVTSLTVIFITLLFVIYLRSRAKNFVFSALTWRKDKEPWAGHGVFQFARVQRSFEITSADPGYIHSSILTWSDYKLSFDFKIAKYGIGVLVRAVNLANYVMLQITEKGIRPHIRINGGWKIWEDTETGLTFDNLLKIGEWYKCEVYCDKDTITIKLFSGKAKIFERFWNIPIGSLVFKFKKDENDVGTDISFPITLEYGSIGFREYGDEKTYVKNVLVEKL